MAEENNTTETDIKPYDNKIHIAALGSCITRDSIGLYHENEKFIVDRFVQDVNPVVLVDNSPLLKSLGDFIFNLKTGDAVISHFRRRNFTLDMEKSVMTYVTETNAEWLFMDVASVRHTFTKYTNGSFTNAQYIDAILSPLMKEGYLPKDGIIITHDEITDSELFERLDRFIVEILNYYPQDRIIFFDTRLAKYYLTKENSLYKFNSTDPIVTILNKSNAYVIQKLPQAHIIEFPVNTLGDENQKWGKSPLHFVREYYDYAYEAVNKIVFSKYDSLESEKEDIRNLRNRYERLIDDKYKNYFYHVIDNYAYLKERDIELTEAYNLRSKSLYKFALLDDDIISKISIDDLFKSEYNLSNYFRILEKLKDKFLIIMAVKDTAGNKLAAEEVNLIQDVMFTNFSSDLHVMYVGIFNRASIVCDQSGLKPDLPVSVCTEVEGVNVTVSSMAFRHGNKADILIDGTNYSVNMRGINIVVYDIERGQLIDSVAFDYHTVSRRCVHKYNNRSD